MDVAVFCLNSTSHKKGGTLPSLRVSCGPSANTDVSSGTISLPAVALADHMFLPRDDQRIMWAAGAIAGRSTASHSGLQPQ
jgi:hypothetical protein